MLESERFAYQEYNNWRFIKKS